MQRILVTGVSRGLGLAIADSLLETGHSIVGVSRSRTTEIESRLLKYPDRFIHHSGDIGDLEQLSGTVGETWLPLQTPFHGLVHNAAIAYDDLITNFQADPLEEMFRINTLGPMLLTRRFIRNNLLHGVKGSIVHISSISAHTGYKGLSAYAASKGALEAFSRTCAREWGEKGIRSNCVVAGFMETDMSSTLDADQKNRIYRRTSLKQATEPTSVAATVRFLLSPEAASITGESLFVDAGTR